MKSVGTQFMLFLKIRQSVEVYRTFIIHTSRMWRSWVRTEVSLHADKFGDPPGLTHRVKTNLISLTPSWSAMMKEVVSAVFLILAVSQTSSQQGKTCLSYIYIIRIRNCWEFNWDLCATTVIILLLKAVALPTKSFEYNSVLKTIGTDL